MINAKLDRRPDGSIRLVMSGHARAAPKGQDLVCAGATTLAYTAAQAAQSLYGQGKLARQPKITLTEGRTLVIATPVEDARKELEHTMWAIGCGLEVLSHNYPGCIRLDNRM